MAAQTSPPPPPPAFFVMLIADLCDQLIEAMDTSGNKFRFSSGNFKKNGEGMFEFASTDSTVTTVSFIKTELTLRIVMETTTNILPISPLFISNFLRIIMSKIYVHKSDLQVGIAHFSDPTDEPTKFIFKLKNGNTMTWIGQQTPNKLELVIVLKQQQCKIEQRRKALTWVRVVELPEHTRKVA